MKKMNILHLTLKKKWFDLILSREKKEEYREIKDYYDGRLASKSVINAGTASESVVWRPHHNRFDAIQFRNGYAKNAPKMLVECKCIRIGTPRTEWSDNAQGEHFIISLGNILKTENI